MTDIQLADALPQLGVYPALPTVMMTTSGTPQTYDGTPAVVSITTGGTAGNELIDVDLPALPVGGSFNPFLVGLRVIFCITTLTNNADVVVITADGSGVIDFYPSLSASGAKGLSAGVELSHFSPLVCFVWCGDAWRVDQWLTGDNFGGDFRYANASVSTNGIDNQANIHAQLVFLSPSLPATTDAAGGDVIADIPRGDGAGRVGLVILRNQADSAQQGLPTADPLVAGALWNSTGTVKISAGPP